MSVETCLRDSVKALVPILVPLVTKVVLPIALEVCALQVRSDRFLQDAGRAAGKGLKQTRAELDDVKDEVFERGQKVYDEGSQAGAEIRGCPGEQGSRPGRRADGPRAAAQTPRFPFRQGHGRPGCRRSRPGAPRTEIELVAPRIVGAGLDPPQRQVRLTPGAEAGGRKGRPYEAWATAGRRS